MASASDITEVRRLTGEATDANGYTDAILGTYVDSLGVTGAVVSVWDGKAAQFAALVDVSEAGASHKFSDLHKNALSRAMYFRGLDGNSAEGRPRVKKITRT